MQSNPRNPQAFLYRALGTFATDFQLHARWDRRQHWLIRIFRGVQVTLALSRSFRSFLLTCQEGSCFFPELSRSAQTKLDPVNHLEQKTISTSIREASHRAGRRQVAEVHASQKVRAMQLKPSYADMFITHDHCNAEEEKQGERGKAGGAKIDLFKIPNC